MIKKIFQILIIFLSSLNINAQLDTIIINSNIDGSNDKFITGYVINSSSNKIIMNVKIKLFVDYNKIIFSYKSDEKGYFKIPKKPYNFYIEFQKDGFMTRYKKINGQFNYFKMYLEPIDNSYISKIPFIDPIKIPIKKINKYNIINIDNIIFNRDSNKLNFNNKLILNKLVSIMKSNPKLIIEIKSLTNYKTPHLYSLYLTNKRKIIVKNYLSHIINKNRIIISENDKYTNSLSILNKNLNETYFVILNPIKYDKI